MSAIGRWLLAAAAFVTYVVGGGVLLGHLVQAGSTAMPSVAPQPSDVEVVVWLSVIESQRDIECLTQPGRVASDTLLSVSESDLARLWLDLGCHRRESLARGT